MKAAIATGDGKVGIRDVPEPVVGDYQCLCEITACATCPGTDRKLLDGGAGFCEPRDYPGILGHESIGRVIAVGKRVRNIAVGDIYLRPTCVYPGERLGSFGSVWGCLAEYGLVTDAAAFAEDHPTGRLNGYVTYQQRVPAGLAATDADLTMLVTLKELASFLVEVEVPFYSSVAVLGAGTIAMAVAYFAKLMGAHPVIAVARRDEALARMVAAGADHRINMAREDAAAAVRAATGGKGVDLVVDTTGSAEVIRSATLMLAENGRVAMYAQPGSAVGLDWGRGAQRKSLVLAGPREEKAHQYLVDLLRLGVVPLRSFYSDTMPFTEVAEGYRRLAAKTASKIVFTMR